MQMKSILAPIGLGGILLFASAGAGHAQTFTLQQLLAGSTFTIPTNTGTSLVFNDFANYIPTDNGLGATAPTSAQITATAINAGTNHPGLRWQSSNWDVNSNQFMSGSWEYDVSTLNGAAIIEDANLNLVSYAADGTGEIHSTESLSNGQNLVVDSLLPPRRITMSLLR